MKCEIHLHLQNCKTLFTFCSTIHIARSLAHVTHFSNQNCRFPSIEWSDIRLWDHFIAYYYETQVMRLLTKGNRERTQEPTKVRHDLILQLTLRIERKLSKMLSCQNIFRFERKKFDRIFMSARMFDRTFKLTNYLREFSCLTKCLREFWCLTKCLREFSGQPDNQTWT